MQTEITHVDTCLTLLASWLSLAVMVLGIAYAESVGWLSELVHFWWGGPVCVLACGAVLLWYAFWTHQLVSSDSE
jgi:hypothetical protein